MGERHRELYDTDVREQVGEAIWRGFVRLEPGYVLPDNFGMFTAEGNRSVRIALDSFLTHACTAALASGLTSSDRRLDAFRNRKVTTDTGRIYDSFFGHFETTSAN